MRTRPRRWQVVLVVFAVASAMAFTVAWERQSGYFAYLPDTAHPADGAVSAPGGKPPRAGSRFFFVDVHVLQANVVQEFWARHLVDGADLVPTHQVLAPGQSYTQERRVDLHAMVTSQQVAQVVAERAIGKRVPIRHGGALVEEVLARSPAARASIRPGDVVVSARGRPVASAQDMVDAMKGVRPGQIVRFGLRGGRIETIRTVPSKDDRRRAIIGVSIGDSVHVGKLPIHVRFSVPGIGGPSAGLAFALEIYDSLTGRQLLRGHKVCVTGELDLAGDVIPIGGAKQKTIGCIDAGADVFLVPAGDNAHDARIAAHGRLRVIAVRSFQGALRVLRALPSARDRG